ncbi:gliding motility-associated C-terminal domain-containing protein [Puia sp.]|uniref:T9SS type B sorting domain-containing protein n=1 Tax=Puia sp. TaxID=2045100 RepID=UPI002F420E41
MLQRFLTNPYRNAFLNLFLLFFLLLSGVGRSFGQGPLTVTATATSACAAPSTIVVTATGGVPGPGGYQYSVDGSAYQPSNVFPNFTGLGAHTVSVLDASGNPATTITLTIDCITFIPVGNSAATCLSNNGSLTVDPTGIQWQDAALNHYVGGGGPYQYSIDHGATWQTSPTFSNLYGNTVAYDVWVLNGNHTIGMATAIVGNLGGATVVPVATDAGCPNNDGTVNVTAMGTAPPFTYKLNDGSFGPKTNFTGLARGDYIAYVTDGNGCVTQAPVTVQQNNTLVLTTGPDVTICEGQHTTLGAASPNGVSYSWTPATTLNNPAVLSPVASPRSSTTYTLVATWGACTQTGTVTVNVNQAPVADAGVGDTTCYGRSTGLMGSATGAAPFSYRWRPTTFLNNSVTAGPTVVQPTASTTYHLVVTDGNGCSSLNDAAATVFVTPPPQLFAGNDTNVVAGQPVPLHAEDVIGSGFVSYQWTPAEGLDNSLVQDPLVIAAGATTTYIATGTTAAGCMGTDSITVKVYTTGDIYVPNAFSPNHDGHNDVLRVIAPGIAFLKMFAVYDRWGAQVFATSNVGIGWDGTRGGRELAPGVYVWMAVGVDFQGRLVERKGTVLLVR